MRQTYAAMQLLELCSISIWRNVQSGTALRCAINPISETTASMSLTSLVPWNLQTGSHCMGNTSAPPLKYSLQCALLAMKKLPFWSFQTLWQPMKGIWPLQQDEHYMWIQQPATEPREGRLFSMSVLTKGMCSWPEVPETSQKKNPCALTLAKKWRKWSCADFWLWSQQQEQEPWFLQPAAVTQPTGSVHPGAAASQHSQQHREEAGDRLTAQTDLLLFRGCHKDARLGLSTGLGKETKDLTQQSFLYVGEYNCADYLHEKPVMDL